MNTFNQKKTILIGELSKQTETNTSTINFYYNFGLLDPPIKINETRSLYPKSNIKKIKEIKKLKKQGLTLNGIKKIFDGKSKVKVKSDDVVLKINFTVEEFINELNIEKQFYFFLLNSNLINTPIDSPEGTSIHSRRDFIVGKSYVNLTNNGLDKKILNKHNEYSELSSAEAIFLQEHLEFSNNLDDPKSFQEIINSFNTIRRYHRENELKKIISKLYD